MDNFPGHTSLKTKESEVFMTVGPTSLVKFPATSFGNSQESLPNYRQVHVSQKDYVGTSIFSVSVG